IEKSPVVLRHIGTLFIVMISFLLFVTVDLAGFGRSVVGLFDFTRLTSAEAVYYLRSYGVLLVLAVIGCTDLPKRCALWLSEKSPVSQVVQILQPVVMLGMLLVSTAYLVDGSFNPFLYFRF
ncbi:MAG: MBOAT family protein, partial [Clostridia bacterium]|nr:MBOAT family protein [Clostridia bacterium]